MMKKAVPRFVQIAATPGTDEGYCSVYGLDSEGRVWWLYDDNKSEWERLTTVSNEDKED